MPALPLDDAGPYVAAAYLVFLALILIYVAIMAGKLVRIARELGELTQIVERREPSPRRGRGGGDGAAMTELLALGASHKTAPLALRERIALTEGGAEPLLRELTEHPAIDEAVVALDLQPHRAVPGGRQPGRGRVGRAGAAGPARRHAADASCSTASTRCATATRHGTCTG